MNRIFTALIVLLAILVPAPSHAGEKPTCFKTFRVALFEFGLMYSSKTNSGADLDFTNELAKRSGCAISVTVMPRTRIWKMLQDGQLDMATSGAATEDREKYAWFINIAGQKLMAVVRSDSSEFTEADFLANPTLRLGIIRGVIYGPVYDAIVARLRTENRIEETSDAEHLFEMLVANRFQAVFALAVIYRPELDRLQFGDRVIITDWAPQQPPLVGGLVLAKATFSADEAQRWRHLILEMKADGTFRRIFEHYMPARDVDNALKFN